MSDEFRRSEVVSDEFGSDGIYEGTAAFCEDEMGVGEVHEVFRNQVRSFRRDVGADGCEGNTGGGAEAECDAFDAELGGCKGFGFCGSVANGLDLADVG